MLESISTQQETNTIGCYITASKESARMESNINHHKLSANLNKTITTSSSIAKAHKLKNGKSSTQTVSAKVNDYRKVNAF